MGLWWRLRLPPAAGRKNLKTESPESMAVRIGHVPFVQQRADGSGGKGGDMAEVYNMWRIIRLFDDGGGSLFRWINTFLSYFHLSLTKAVL